MDLQIEVKLKAMDFFRYNMRNAYTSMQGILSIVFAALVIFVFIWKFDRLTVPYMILFILLAVAFLVYIPISLWLRSNQLIKTSDIFKEPLTLTFTDEAIIVTSPVMTEEENTSFTYEDIFKVAKTKNYILLYTNRISAYIIPRGQLADKEAELEGIIKDKVDDFKLRGFNK